jgi:hypothetical protein
MTRASVSFDDEDGEELYVFSGGDLLMTHYDAADLDWEEVAERAALDERRGLVITQVAILEDLIDEFIHYLADPADPEAYQAELDKCTIGPRLNRLEKLLRRAGLRNRHVAELFNEIRSVIARRNELAHGTIHRRPVEPVVPGSWVDGIPLEWIITSRRSKTMERLTMSRLRQDLYDAIGCFSAMLEYAERFVEIAPRPTTFRGGRYLGAPTP